MYINKGTFGSVYKILMNRRYYALKKTKELKGYAHREREILQDLSHKNITNLHYFWYVGEEEPTLHLIIDYFKFSLYDLLSNGKYSGKHLRLHFKQVLSALQYLHSRGICHRDMKPQNILIMGDRLKICDFGSAKKLQGCCNITYITSRNYRAPENLIDRNRSYGLNIDIWAVGVIFLEIYLYLERGSFSNIFIGGLSTEVLHSIIIKLDIQREDLKIMGVYDAMISVCSRFTRSGNILHSIRGDIFYVLEGALRFVNNERMSAHQLLLMEYFK